MTASWKCTGCGLVNFAADANCKRCAAPAPSAGSVQPASQAGITLEDGYVLPPPPTSGGIWRDGKTLVMTKDAFLPDGCVRCNAPANGYRLQKRLSWHHPVLYLLIFGAALFYLILALALSKRAAIDFPLCADHVRRRRTMILIGWGVFLLAIATVVLASVYDYAGIALSAMLVILVDIVWLVIAYKIVTVKKIDDRYVWLTGISKEFLLQFPPLPGEAPPPS